ncbi:MAG: glycosyltransferase, partial [Gammaproteobacteria bacterium]
ALDRSGIELEIVLADDASEAPFGKWHQGLEAEGVRVFALSQNMGRAAVRNFLARQARAPWLLFADADSAVVHPDFFLQYARAARQAPVVVGGTVYADEPPPERALRLRWHYGRRREQLPATRRQGQPWASFRTHNFLIHREAFWRVGGFDEAVRRYGHEDTLFGESLRRAGIPVLHIDNPLLHLGLEPAEVFIEKTRQAVAGLVALERAGKAVPTRLGAIATRWGWAIGWLPDRFLAQAEKRLARYLIGASQPPLVWFDLFKLIGYVREKRRATQSGPPENA